MKHILMSSIGFIKAIKNIQKDTYIKLSSTTKRGTDIVNKENCIGDKMVEYNENKISRLINFLSCTNLILLFIHNLSG